MSTVAQNETDPQSFMDPAEARLSYSLTTHDSVFATELDKELTAHSIARVAMPIPRSDFEHITQQLETCTAEIPDQMAATAYRLDYRKGMQAGFKRKNREFEDGIQVEDAKILFHFTESARRKWSNDFRRPPKILADFLKDGFELHHALIAISRELISQLDHTHPNIVAAHFPHDDTVERSLSFMRVGSYDSYTVEENMGTVAAKPHQDSGHFTLQAFADNPGFWGSEGPGTQKTHYDTTEGHGYMFAGSGYENLYANFARYKALYHGVERPDIPVGSEVPGRHAVILFTDAPDVDPKVTTEQNQPEIPRSGH